MKLAEQRAHDRGVRDILATVCVEWYFERVRLWWSAWLLLWHALGGEIERRRLGCPARGCAECGHTPPACVRRRSS